MAAILTLEDLQNMLASADNVQMNNIDASPTKIDSYGHGLDVAGSLEWLDFNFYVTDDFVYNPSTTTYYFAIAESDDVEPGVDVGWESFWRATVPDPIATQLWSNSPYAGWKNKDITTGSFDGGGFKITDLTTTESCGMFNEVSGDITNTNLRDVSITSSSSCVVTGGLVAKPGNSNAISVSKCSVTGTVIGGAATVQVGGVLGQTLNSAVISECYFSGTVQENSTSANLFVGLFAGQVQASGIIRDCYAVGTLDSNSTSGTNEDLGGFCGRIGSGSSSGVIQRCHANVILDIADAGYGRNGCTNSFNAGDTCNDSFYNSTIAGTVTPAGNDTSGEIATGVTALTTAEMSNPANFTNWDFNTIWYMDGYPKLIEFRTSGPFDRTRGRYNLNKPFGRARYA